MSDLMDKDLTASSIGEAFKQCVAHMKTGFPVWEDFLLRGFKLHRQLENTVTVFANFMEGLGKVADTAARGRAGGTSDIGAGLSNLISWHKAQEFKIKEMNSSLSSKLLVPLQSKIEEWKKTTSQMDREHDKEVQKAVKEIREASKSTLKTHKHLESKLKKDKTDKVSILQHQLEQQRKEVSRLVQETEDRERENLNKILLEERRWYSGFVAGFSKSLDVEVSMFSDVERLKTILSELGDTVSQPNTLPVTTKDFIENWSIPLSSPHSKRRPSVHNSCASLNSSHSVSSLGSQDSINISAPVPPGSHPPGTHPPGAHPTGTTPPSSNGVPPPPPMSSSSHPVPPAAPVAPTPPVAPPLKGTTPPPAAPPPPAPDQGAQYAQLQGAQYAHLQGAPPTNGHYSQGQAMQQNYGTQYAPVNQQMQTAPPPPPQYAPPTSQYAPSTSQYAPSTSQYAPPTSQYSPPTSQYAQYPPQGPQQGTQLPPPPPPNFPPTPDTYYDPNSNYRPHPPGPSNVAYDENFEPISVPSSMSVSPSQVSLSSHQSSESGRSLSPPIGPTRSPNQNRAQLSSLQEEVAPPTDLQSALLSRLKQRSNSFDMNDPTGHHSSLPRTTSVGARPPPVSYKPPRGPNKPSRSSSLRIASSSAHAAAQYQQQHNHAPNPMAPPPPQMGGGVPPPPHMGGGVPPPPPQMGGGAPPHHVLNPNANRYSACSSDSDDVEEESAFAKALREKKKKVLSSR